MPSMIDDWLEINDAVIDGAVDTPLDRCGWLGDVGVGGKIGCARGLRGESSSGLETVLMAVLVVLLWGIFQRRILELPLAVHMRLSSIAITLLTPSLAARPCSPLSPLSRQRTMHSPSDMRSVCSTSTRQTYPARSEE